MPSLLARAALTVLICLASGAAWAEPPTAIGLDAEPGRWAARTELLFDPATRSLVRREVRVWDGHPSRRLAFAWAPDASSRLSAGPAAGSGRLTWRPEATPSYDATAIVIDYHGTLANGRPDGLGTERHADGLVYEGRWKAGRPEGPGHLRLSNGADYRGAFHDGHAEGQGTFTDIDGEVYVGWFHNGLREGVATTVLPNHVRYRSAWRGGIEVAASRKLRLAQLGNGGNAPEQDIRIGITVLGHPAEDQRLGYAGTNAGDALEIAPDDKRLMSLWKGNGELQAINPSPNKPGTFDYRADDLIPIRLTMNVQNRGGDRAQVVGAFVKVDSSLTDLQPAVELETDLDNVCGGELKFAPSFILKNYGWGPVRKPSIEYTFGGKDAAPLRSLLRRDKSIDDIAVERKVDFERDLVELGVDAPKLRRMLKTSTPFRCRSSDESACLNELRSHKAFGSLAPFVFLSDDRKILVRLVGVLSYDWSDDRGGTHSRKSPFATSVLLGQLPLTAECGEGGEAVPVTPNPIVLRLHASDYRLPIKFYGTVQPGRTSRYTFTLRAAKSSEHRLSLVLQLADGREIKSRPVHVTYFVPNWTPRN